MLVGVNVSLPAIAASIDTFREGRLRRQRRPGGYQQVLEDLLRVAVQTGA